MSLVQGHVFESNIEEAVSVDHWLVWFGKPDKSVWSDLYVCVACVCVHVQGDNVPTG